MPRKQRTLSEDLDVRDEDTMGWHRPDLRADLGNGARGPRVRRIEDANRVHQFLDRGGRMADLALRHEVIQDLRRTVLHLVDIDTSIEQQPLPAIDSASTKGNSSSRRREKVVRRSNRAHRRAASKSSAATSKAEFQLRIDLSSRRLEGAREIVLESHGGQCELDEVGVGFDPRLGNLTVPRPSANVVSIHERSSYP